RRLPFLGPVNVTQRIRFRPPATPRSRRHGPSGRDVAVATAEVFVLKMAICGVTSLPPQVGQAIFPAARSAAVSTTSKLLLQLSHMNSYLGIGFLPSYLAAFRERTEESLVLQCLGTLSLAGDDLSYPGHKQHQELHDLSHCRTSFAAHRPPAVPGTPPTETQSPDMHRQRGHQADPGPSWLPPSRRIGRRAGCQDNAEAMIGSRVLFAVTGSSAGPAPTAQGSFGPAGNILGRSGSSNSRPWAPLAPGPAGCTFAAAAR